MGGRRTQKKDVGQKDTKKRWGARGHKRWGAGGHKKMGGKWTQKDGGQEDMKMSTSTLALPSACHHLQLGSMVESVFSWSAFTQEQEQIE